MLENQELTEETVTEVVTDVVEEVPTEEIVEEIVEEVVEESVEETQEEVKEEVKEEEVVEPVTFDVTLETPVLVEKVTEVLEKYELPQDVQAGIDVLIAKANDNALAEYADYGDVDAIKTLLDRQNLLVSDRSEANGYRPNTDEFVKTLDADRATWLSYDLDSQPSVVYQGITRFQEKIVNAFGVEGEPIGKVLEKYEQFVTAMKSGVITSDVPEFIPVNVQEAYYQLDKETRNEIAMLDLESEYDQATLTQKLKELTLIQNGINADKDRFTQTTQSKALQEQQFQTDVIAKQTAFYDVVRDQFAKDLHKEVQFSADPKMQTLLANQQVSLLTQAFEDGSAGEFARNTLKEAGITFDAAKAQQLMQTVEQASVTLTAQERAKKADGTPLDAVELNKAKSFLQKAGKEWQNFASDILKQVANVASTGKQEDIQKAVAKQKIAVKARSNPNGSPSVAKKQEQLPPMGSIEWDKYWARKTMDEQAKRAQLYQGL